MRTALVCLHVTGWTFKRRDNQSQKEMIDLVKRIKSGVIKSFEALTN
jgi:hypothetical protein